jgi:hypothetical protein
MVRELSLMVMILASDIWMVGHSGFEPVLDSAEQLATAYTIASFFT